jgi:hypothetical protein
MGWYALEEIQNALDDTKELLLPFNWKTWAKIAFITIFLGGSGLSNIPTPSAPSDTGQAGTSYEAPMESFNQGQLGLDSVTGMATGGDASLAAALLVIGIVIPVVLAFMLLSSVFKFVMYQSLMDTDVQIRKNFSRHFGKGLRFLGAQLVIVSLVMIYILGVALSFGAAPMLGIAVLLGSIPVIIVAALAMRIFNDFIPLKMMDRDSGVIEALGSLWEDVKAEWRQVLLYVLVVVGLGIGTGILYLMGMVFLGLIFLIVLGIPAFLLASISEILGILVGGFAVVLFLAMMLYLFDGPITTFLHYYSIRFYHRLTS